jgi:hypothetical protein
MPGPVPHADDDRQRLPVEKPRSGLALIDLDDPDGAALIRVLIRVLRSLPEPADSTRTVDDAP